MVASLSGYTIDGQQVEINPAQVPAFSVLSTITLKRINETLLKNVNIPEPLNKVTMKDRIQTMEETVPLLKHATDHRLRDMSIALLKTAFVAACIAGSFYGIGLLGLDIVEAMLLASFPYTVFTSILCFNIGDKTYEIEERRPEGSGHSYKQFISKSYSFSSLFLWPALPLCEAATRKSRLEAVVQAQKESIQEQINIGYQLSHGRNLVTTLNEKIEKFSKRTNKTQDEEDALKFLQHLQKELNIAREFYQAALEKAAQNTLTVETATLA